MSKVLLESTREPGKTKLVSRRDAIILIKLGRWKRASSDATPPAEKRARRPAPDLDTLTSAAKDLFGKPPADPTAHVLLDALIAKHGELSNATVAELEDAADAYGLQEADIEGSGANGNVLKADWLRELEQLRKGPGRYARRDMQAGTDYNTQDMQPQ